MVKLVRHALTAAILTAVVVRLRRRARTTSPEVAPRESAEGRRAGAR
ncbi:MULTISPECIES: hypothetical protein [Nonomuraea]|uniref:Uncharacterized protein n=1 Tax=Nonomuraea mangrovi TaxID=2316207 RepID=A0ABW4T7S7_9ACTN